MSIQCRNSSSTVTDSLSEPLDLESLSPFPADFRVMQIQLDELDESLEDLLIPKAYRDLANVFSLAKANSLPPHRDEDHAIELEPGKTPPFGPLYNLSEHQLKILREYIDENLQNGFIRPSKSSAGAPVLFAPKPDGTLRLCVDYRGLNAITMKNRYPLPLINEILDRLSGAQVFTKIDVKNAYYRLRIREGDEWKTAFRTRYGLFEYLVMPFGLTNAPASFQSYIHGVLRQFLDVTVIVYLDDILVFSRDPSQHEKHVREVLKALFKAGLYAKFSKCLFSVTRLPFLGFILTDKGVEMEEDRISTILNWPEPESVREIQSFLGFANFYRRFVKGFSRIAHPLTDMTKGAAQRTKKDLALRKKDFLTTEARRSFHELVATFTTSPFLAHFDAKCPIKLETDASGYAISGILSQKQDSGWKVVAYFSRKMIDAERNYEVHDAELLAIVESFRHWRHYLEPPQHSVEVLTDHNNLHAFMTTHKLTRRQVRWALELSAFDFRLVYRKGSLNPADGPSRRPDYQRVAEEEDSMTDNTSALQRMLFPSVAAVTSPDPREERARQVLVVGTSDSRSSSQRSRARGAVSYESMYEDVSSFLLDALPEFLRADPLAKKVTQRLATRESNTNADYDLHDWTQRGELLYKGSVLYIPEVEALRMQILKKHHNDLLAGHLATKKTYNTIRTN